MVDNVSSFWGPVTSTHEWCEQNYIYSSYIAEFINTVSIVPGILLAVVGLLNSLRQDFEKRFSVLHISNVILAIGSMLYHATLQRLQQQGDETPMVWEMLLYIYILYICRCTLSTSFGHWFQSPLCASLPRMYKYYILTDDGLAKRLAKLYHLTLLGASLCWLVDRLFCEDISRWYFNPQGHALWHIFMGFNSYFANTFLMYCRGESLSRVFSLREDSETESPVDGNGPVLVGECGLSAIHLGFFFLLCFPVSPNWKGMLCK